MMVWKSTFLLGWSLFKGELLNFRGVHAIHVEIETFPSKKYFGNRFTIVQSYVFLEDTFFGGDIGCNVYKVGDLF